MAAGRRLNIRAHRPRSGRVKIAQHFSAGFASELIPEPVKRATENTPSHEPSVVRFADWDSSLALLSQR